MTATILFLDVLPWSAMMSSLRWMCEPIHIVAADAPLSRSGIVLRSRFASASTLHQFVVERH